jgi:hypothetical protein
MSDPWFDPRLVYVFGPAVGVLGGVLGPMVGVLAPRGKAKRLVLAGCAAMLVAAVVGFASGQPRIIWYSLGLAGGVGTVVFGSLTPVVLLRYRQAEARRMAAGDLK